MKFVKFGKTRKDTRWKRGEFVVVERERRQSESEDEGMRELREKFKADEVGKHSRRKGCQFVFTKGWRISEDEKEERCNKRCSKLERPSKTSEGRKERLLPSRSK